MATLLDDLVELLRISSVSAGRPNPEGIRQAAEWLKARIERSGGEAELSSDPNPLVLGELRANRPDAPDVLVYGHYDVQDVGPADEWLSDPFEPEIRDGRIYARGASDDKGNALPVLHAACEMHAAGELPVNVRVVMEGEEESTSIAVMDWIRRDELGADAAIVFDATMAAEDMPAITTACRGMVAVSLSVRVAERDHHSGLYGGTRPNAIHALERILAAVIPRDDFRPREELRAGVAPPADSELESWKTLPPNPEFHLRTGADASLEVNGVISGATDELRTIIPAVARANLSLRTAPGQSSAELAGVLAGLLRDAAPAYAQVEIETHTAEPVSFDPESAALRLARTAFERATGRPPALMRSGGTIPVLAAFAERGIQTVVSGYALPGDAIHAPNESFRLESIELGERTARCLFAEFAQLR